MNSKPIIRDSYCVYLDVLGFTSRVMESLNSGNPQPLFQNFLSAINQNLPLITPSGSHNLKNSWEIKVFTDNIVLGHPIETSHGEDEFASAIMGLSFFQLSMALSGFFVRGAFVKGKLFIDEDTVYGPALINAYKLESSAARVPRIIFSNEVYQIINQHLDFYSEQTRAPHYTDILEDEDGYAFVNYLSDLNSERLHWNEIESHKELIEDNLKQHSGEPRIWSKYHWLGNYHNYFVKQYSSLPSYSDKYLIDDDLLKNEPSKII